jgi:ATP-grasp domain
MPNVVFVAPFLLETTLRFLRETAGLPGVRLGLVTQHDADRIPADVRDGVAVLRVDDALDANAIAGAVGTFAARAGGVDRLLGALEELQVPLGEVRERLGLPGMRGEAARNFRDKARMKEVLAAAGLPCARHRRVRDDTDARAFAAEVGFPLIVKPTSGSGSQGTFRVENAEQLESALSFGEATPAAPVMLEEYVTGREHSFDSVFLDGRVRWFSSCHYFPGPLEVLENPWIQWCVIIPREADSAAYRDIFPVAERSLQALGMTDGFSHMEWFRRRDGSLAISEVGARPPGAQFVSLMSWAHDRNLYRAWAELMVFGRFDPPPRPYASGAAFLRGHGKGRIVAVHGVQEAAREVGNLAVEVRLPRPGQAPGGTYDGDGYVIVRHPRTEVVAEALDKIVRTIRLELG